MPPAVPFLPRSAAWSVLLATAVAVAAPLVGAPPAVAKAPRCPTAEATTAASWGVGRDDFDSSLEIDVPRTGLATAKTVEIRTTRTRDGRSRRFLCANGRLRARLPSFGPRSLSTVSVNGSYVAWVEAGQRARAVVTVARVQGGRLRAVRRTRTSAGTGRGSVPGGGLVVLSTGTAAWTSGYGKTADGAVWRRGHPVVPFSRGVPSWPLLTTIDRTTSTRNVTVLDDRNVIVGSGGVLRAYRPPVPGRCPNLVVGQWNDLAGWRVADIGGYTEEGSEVIVSTERSVVCDPALGRHLDISTAGRYSEKHGSGATAFGTVARNGRWLLRAIVGEGEYAGNTEVSIFDPTTGERHVAAGNLDAPGVPAPPETADGTEPYAAPDSRMHTGAVVVPGATAWIERAPASATSGDDLVWLSDRAGTRAVAAVPVRGLPDAGSGSTPTRRYISGLTIAGNTLSWSAEGTPSSVAVDPVPGEPFAARAGTSGR